MTPPARRAIDRIGIATLLIACFSVASCREHPAGDAASRSAAQAPAMAANPTVAASPSDEGADPLKLLERAEQIAARVDPVEWSVDAKAEALAPDVDAKAETLRPDIEPIFLFVRDSILYDPYAGILRGAGGTYTARAGNAADRALLLAHLLSRKGVTTRFVIGTLAERQRERLFLHAFDAPAASTRGLPPMRSGQTFHERLFQRAQHDYDAVRSALGERLRPVTKPSRSEVLAEMNPHVWVQAEVDGRWIDLDPSLPDATPGAAVATPERVVAELPAELFQRITIRVVAEHLSNGDLVPSTLLEIALNSVDLVDTQVALIHTQPSGFKGIGFAIGNALGRPSEFWSPALWVAGTFTFGASVDVGAADFVGERIEFELQWPGGRKELSHRQLADRASAAWRATRPLNAAGLHRLERGDSGAFAMQAVHNIWLSAGRHNLADFTQALLELAERQLLSATADTASDGAAGHTGSAGFGDSLWPMVLQNFTWMLWTDHVIIPLLNDTPGVRLFADGPRIAIFTEAPAADDRVINISDLRRDDLRGLAADTSKQLRLAEKKLRYGLLQGALEQEALAELALIDTGDSSGVTSTSQRIARGPLMVLTAADASADAPAPQGLAGHLTSALAAGCVVVASANTNERDAWWEIAAGTGDTTATGELGLHWGTTQKGRGPRVQGGRGGISYTKEAAAEIEKTEREAKHAEKLAEIIRENERNPTRAMPEGNKFGPKQGGGGGGMEYAILVVVATIESIAFVILSQMLIEKIYSETELLIVWLQAGGFREAVGQP